jgi:hypothetical protein
MGVGAWSEMHTPHCKHQMHTVFPLDLSPVSTIQLFARVVETVGASRSRPDLFVVVGVHSAILFCNSQCAAMFSHLSVSAL